jgi:hypothetical protein
MIPVPAPEAQKQLRINVLGSVLRPHVERSPFEMLVGYRLLIESLREVVG